MTGAADSTEAAAAEEADSEVAVRAATTGTMEGTTLIEGAEAVEADSKVRILSKSVILSNFPKSKSKSQVEVGQRFLTSMRFGTFVVG